MYTIIQEEHYELEGSVTPSKIGRLIQKVYRHHNRVYVR